QLISGTPGTISSSADESQSTRLLPVRDPDVLDLGRGPEELLARALLAVKPIPRPAVVDPGALEAAGGCPLDHGAPLRGAEVPDRVHVVMLGQHPHESVSGARDDVDDTAGHVG